MIENQTVNNEEIKINNSWLQVNKMRNFKDIRNIVNNNKFLCSNIKYNLIEKYIDELEAFEKKNKKREYANSYYKNIYGLSIQILLPKDIYNEQFTLMSNDKLIRLANTIARRIINKETNLKWFCCVHKKVNAHYLIFYFSDREYLPHIKYIKYDKDLYKNKLTGRWCKESDPNAVLIHRKGEFKYDKNGNKAYEDVLFKDHKCQRFRYSPFNAKWFFLSLRIIYKTTIIELKLVKPSYSFKRYSLIDEENRWQRRIFTRVNIVQQSLELLFTSFQDKFLSYEVLTPSKLSEKIESGDLKEHKIINHQIKAKLDNLYFKLSARFAKGSWHDDKGKLRKIKFTRADIADENIQLLLQEARKELNNIQTDFILNLQN